MPVEDNSGRGARVRASGKAYEIVQNEDLLAGRLELLDASLQNTPQDVSETGRVASLPGFEHGETGHVAASASNGRRVSRPPLPRTLRF